MESSREGDGLLFVRGWSPVGMVMIIGVSGSESAWGDSFHLKYFQRKKEKKESVPFSGGFKRSQVFLEKYYLSGRSNRNGDGGAGR